MFLNRYLSSITRSPRLLLVTAVLLLLVVNLLDIAAGSEISTSIFYLLPVGIVAWYINRRGGLLFALLGAIIWLITDVSTNLVVSHPLIPFWNALVRFGFFSLVVLSLSSLRKSREKGEELMAFVVHDLRAPLGNMLTALEMLQRETEKGSSGYVTELIDIALASGRRMLILVSSLLDLARLEGGKMPVKYQTVPITDLFQRATDHVMFMARQKEITIRQEVGVESLTVTVDPDLTERVLVNLLSNAVKFTPDSGSIYLSADLTSKEQVVIGVRDDGPGIPLQLEKQAFSRFGQVENQSRGTIAGSGLGLAFCKLAIEVQNGRIWLEPTPDKGTLIQFTLPR
jgi:signal transduction histidine kinase